MSVRIALSALLLAALSAGSASAAPIAGAAAFGLPVVLAIDAEEPAGGHAKPGHDTDEAVKDGPALIPAADLALWSVVTFVVLLTVLRLAAWGPIVTGLDTRESRIRQDIAEAEADRARAAAILAEHETRLKSVEAEIREMRSEARAQADKMKADAVTAGKEEAAALVEKAKGEIEQDRRQAEDQLKREIATMVVQAAEQVVGRKLNDGDERRLADEALQQFAGSLN